MWIIWTTISKNSKSMRCGDGQGEGLYIDHLAVTAYYNNNNNKSSKTICKNQILKITYYKLQPSQHLSKKEKLDLILLCSFNMIIIAFGICYPLYDCDGDESSLVVALDFPLGLNIPTYCSPLLVPTIVERSLEIWIADIASRHTHANDVRRAMPDREFTFGLKRLELWLADRALALLKRTKMVAVVRCQTVAL